MSLSPALPRRHLLVAGGALGAGVALGGGLAVVAPGLRWAQAGGESDIAILQTAMSIERALVDAYRAVSGLAVVAGPQANPTVATIVADASAHHDDHLAAFTDALSRRDGALQNQPSGTVSRLVTQAQSSLTTVGLLVGLLASIETVAAHSYQNAVGLVADSDARTLMAAVAGTEYQHLAVMEVLGALATAGALASLTVGAGARAGLPAGTAAAAAPQSAASTDEARPPGEGAVR